ncbi:NAD(P)/FAD-dependent oxidoreductase [Sporolituus thermophilus]|uniref:Pyridine nucleotide-disulphide oxidoreductase n=1 Tax=Sporolituus thermophilus DSM 23256 TaxID=1123285 RepID=A0A1G7NVQ2_9FIRM|nr:FAD-dependent oxidoreductase [Sporolituus thermophilus]SDF78023.1 Pyridine nucleotide-disulphide oxidoreductase [Sporolituus thermophilus DSM 23256]
MYVIIGQGAAGTAAANTLRQLDGKKAITVITKETDYFYSRVDLPDIIAGYYPPSAAMLQTKERFAELGISCRMGEMVTAIIPEKKTVRLAGGECLEYEKLLVATGSVPVLPPITGLEAKGVYTLWTMTQAGAIIRAAAGARTAVVIGAGLIGVKTALALAARGLAVTLVEKLPRVLPRQVDAAAGAIVARRIAEKGVAVMTGAVVEGIATEDGAIVGVKVSGQMLACDLAVVAVGVRPEAELARQAGLEVRRGIVVDRFLQTSRPDIYAAGDVAEAPDFSGGYSVPARWPVAVEQGQVAASNMAGRKAAYLPVPAMNAVEVAGLPLISVGDVEGEPGDDILVSAQGDNYKKLVIRDKIVCGVLCIGDIRQAGVLGGLVIRQAEVRAAGRLLAPEFGFADLLAM